MAIFRNCKTSYPKYLAGQLTLDQVVLEDLLSIPDSTMKVYGDVVVGQYKGTVISVCQITGWTRRAVRDGRDRMDLQGNRIDHPLLPANSISPVKWKRGQGLPYRLAVLSDLQHEIVVDSGDTVPTRLTLSEHIQFESGIDVAYRGGVLIVTFPLGMTPELRVSTAK